MLVTIFPVAWRVGDYSLSTNAVAGSEVEGLESVLVVLSERRVAKPSLGVVALGVHEVLLGVVHGPLVDGDGSL